MTFGITARIWFADVMHFDARVVLIDVFVEVGFDDAVVVDAESLTEGILRDLEPAIDVSS
jgi:hypothetical protein